MNADRRITLAITGASGMPYALTLLRALLLNEREVFLMISEAARDVLRHEMEVILPDQSTECATALRALCKTDQGILHVLGTRDWTSAVASGSATPRRMVICPCSMGTLAAIAHGMSNNLIERAADVIMKERYQLIIVPREMPFSTLHLENMTQLSRLGVTVMPAAPAFYLQATTIQDLVNFVVDRILAHLQLPTLLPGWGETPQMPQL